MATVEFDRLVSYFDADLSPLEKGVARGIKLVDSLERKVKNFKGKISLTTTSGSGRSTIDSEMRKAEGDIRRFERERIAAERRVTQAVQREERARATARNREQRRSSNEFLANLRRTQAEERRATRGGRGTGGGLGEMVMGNLGAAGTAAGIGLLANQSREAFMSLDKLVRFVSTLDASFQEPEMLKKLRLDIVQLSMDVPQSADAIAKAAFSVKSAYQKMSEPELISFLKTLSIQATASNTTVDQHADRVIAMAKMYNIAAADLDKFGAILSTTFGAALSRDSEVAEGFNQLLVPARNVRQSLLEIAAAQGAVQSATGDAASNTTNLLNLYQKLADPKWQEGFKQMGVEVFDAQGKYKGLNQIVNELAKSLQGLTDKQRIDKMDALPKDAQARAGILSLIETLEQYNGLLRDGADTEAFAKKQKTMLESTDAKWQKLMNRVEAYKTLIGSIMAETADGDLAAAGKGFLQANPVSAPWVNWAPQAEKAGLSVGQLFTTGLVGALVSGKGQAQAAQNGLIQADGGGASQKGTTIGQQFAAGVASGIRSGYGWAGAAAAGIVDWMFSSGKQAAESHSPSERAARELGLPFVQGIAKGIDDPKSKKKLKESIKKLYDDLVYEGGRIDPTTGQSKDAITRQFAAGLDDASGGYSEQVDRIAAYYDRVYEVEEQAYQRRLANIAQREAAIAKRKDLKPQERSDMLRGLGDERTDAGAAREQGRFDWQRNLGTAIGEAGSRRIEQLQRDLARTFIESENSMIDVRRTAVQEAQTAYDQEIQLINGRLDAYRDERDNYEAGSAEYIAWNNKIIDGEQDRADAVAKGAGDIKRARTEDRRSMQDLMRAVADFNRDTVDAQFDADQAKIDLMRSTGVAVAEIFAAEQVLAIAQENFRNGQRVRDIQARRDDLLQRSENEAEMVQIIATANAQMEAEAARHKAAMQQIMASQGQNSILGQWKALAAQLPGYQQQLKDFAVSMPESIGGAFAQITTSWDGTWKGFLASLKESFFRVIQEMLAELMRVQLIKGIIGMIGAISGSASGGSALSDGDPGLYGFADGGVPPMGRVSVVGERGPELFVPSVAGRVLSHEDSMAVAAGKGKAGNTTIINFSQTIKGGPRGMVSPKSTKQQTNAAITGLSYGDKGR